jgi:transcriptional regulator with XRE-family HTH domain
LSLADVARLLGTSSRNAYASYEQGRTEPTLGKFRELLMAVAPEMTLTVGPRSGPRAAKPASRRKSEGQSGGPPARVKAKKPGTL